MLVGSAARLIHRHLGDDAQFDATICVCQGGFVLLGGRDEPSVFARVAASLRPGGRLALTAFSVAFALRFLEDGETFDPATGVLHEHATVRDPDGAECVFDLWTTCCTPRKLELLARRARLVVDGVFGVFGVQPGRYGRARPTIEHPEILLIAHASDSIGPTFD